ncbi:hypothetical protein [Faecalibacter macacae]|nr:hypothetical protein [Faecalibacter macacae]
MPKHFLYICITLALLVRSAFAPITMLVYTIEKDAFVEYLCINTDQPELHCEGSCQLKKIGDFYEHQHKENHKSISYISIVWNISTTSDFEIYTPLVIKKQQFFHYTNFYQFIFEKADLKPPVV